MKRARRKAAARFSRPEGSGNRFAATRARDFSESCRSTPPHPSRPFQAAPPSPQGEGGAVFCFCLPFTRPRRSLPPCHGAPGSSRPTRSARYPVAGIRKAPLVASGRDYIRRGRRLGGPCPRGGIDGRPVGCKWVSVLSVGALHEAPACALAGLRKGTVGYGRVWIFSVGEDDPVLPSPGFVTERGRTESSAPTNGGRCRLPFNRPGREPLLGHGRFLKRPYGCVWCAVPPPQNTVIINNPNSPRTGRFSQSIPFAAPPFRP